MAWDITGDAKTALHASVGLYHNPHVNANGLDAMARNPPVAEHAEHHLRHDGHAARGRARRARSRTGPSSVFGIERDAQTPKSYNYSAGMQREIGWGTVLDVTYAGQPDAQRRDVDEHQPVPDGARFLDVNPQNADPQQSRRRRSRTSSCARTRATRTSPSARTSARRRTTRCRCSSIAATSTACSSRVAYTLGEDRRPRPNERPADLQPAAARRRVERRAVRVDAAAQLHRQLHVGRARTAAGCGTTC